MLPVKQFAVAIVFLLYSPLNKYNLAYNLAYSNPLMEIGSFEAKNKLSELIERAGKGEEITITRRGQPVARLLPPETESEQSPKLAASRILDRARGASLGNIA